MRVGVDLMGSDLPPQAVFEAALQVSKECVATSFVVYATQDFYPDLKNQYRVFLDQSKHRPAFEFVFTQEAITMQDSPLLAVRRKKKSSIALAMKDLRAKKIDAMVSATNTGALVATAILHLSLLPSINKPSLCVLLPKKHDKVAVLDVGANISFKSEHLLDYAKMGVAFRKCAHGIKCPKVGLLNIGTEEKKGTVFMKEGYQLLQESLQGENGIFVGNIEGKDVLQSDIDVLLTEGFTGNVFLKTCEGVSSFLLDQVKKALSKEEQAKVSSLEERYNYSSHGGALLCGVEGIVIKCHGYSDERALISGIREACIYSEMQLMHKIKSMLH